MFESVLSRTKQCRFRAFRPTGRSADDKVIVLSSAASAELSVNELKLFNSLPLLLKHTGQVTCTFDARSGRGGGGN